MVVAHAARIVVDDVLERRDLILHFEHLVDLLLILDDDEADTGILQHEEHFAGHRILVERHRHATQALGGGHHHVQVRPVVADDGQVVAPLEAEEARPQARARTRSATSAHVQVCQIPRYFSRMAGALGAPSHDGTASGEGVQPIHRGVLRLRPFLCLLIAATHGSRSNVRSNDCGACRLTPALQPASTISHRCDAVWESAHV